MPKLSLCIPTYNRAGYLIELLESVVATTTAAERAQVEICVSDNASTDDTEARVREFSAHHGLPVHYRRNERNLGADQNFLNAVAMASGEYCWLMGSDDMLAPGLVGQVLARLEAGNEVLLMGRLVCNLHMVPHHDEDWLDGPQEERFFDFRDRATLLSYLDRARSLGAVLSFLSSIVVARREWNAITFDPSYLGSAYSHVYILLQVALRSGIHYAPSLRVLNRSGNDSFLDRGAVNRVLIDYRGYTRLADDLLAGDAEVKAAFLGVLARERPLLRTSLLLANHATPAQWQEARGFLLRMGARGALLELLRRLSPVLRPGYDTLLLAYRRLRYGRPG